MPRKPSHISANSVARELLSELDDSGDLYGSGLAAQVSLPDGRQASLRIRFDDDAGIGRGVFGDHDDVYGEFVFRGRDTLYGYPGERPRHFNGRARVLRPRDNGSRIGDEVWWQPPAEVQEHALKGLERWVRGWVETGDWVHVTASVVVDDHGGEAGGHASLSGIEWGHVPDDHDEYQLYLLTCVSDLLHEAQIGRASTAAVPTWARESVDAIVRRLDLEGERVLALLTWWRESVEARGDWDLFGGPMTDAMEHDFIRWLSDPAEQLRVGRPDPRTGEAFTSAQRQAWIDSGIVPAVNDTFPVGGE